MTQSSGRNPALQFIKSGGALFRALGNETATRFSGGGFRFCVSLKKTEIQVERLV